MSEDPTSEWIPNEPTAGIARAEPRPAHPRVRLPASSKGRILLVVEGIVITLAVALTLLFIYLIGLGAWVITGKAK